MSGSYTRSFRSSGDRLSTSSTISNVGSSRLSTGSSLGSRFSTGSTLSSRLNSGSSVDSRLSSSSRVDSRLSSVSSLSNRYITHQDRAATGGYTRSSDVTSSRTGLFPVSSTSSSIKTYTKPTSAADTANRRPSYTGSSGRVFESSSRDGRAAVATSTDRKRYTEQNLSSSRSQREVESKTENFKKVYPPEKDNHLKYVTVDREQNTSFRRQDSEDENISAQSDRLVKSGNELRNRKEGSPNTISAHSQTEPSTSYERSRQLNSEADFEEKVASSKCDSISSDYIHAKDEDQGKKLRVNNTTKPSASTTSVSNNGNQSQKEIVRLESLCESRTKELIQTKIELKACANGFDAMAVLVNYCCNELNAFECSFLAKELDKMKVKLAEYLHQINELSAERERLNQSLTQVIQEKEEASKQIQEALTQVNLEREEHTRITHEMDYTHNASLTAQRDELTKKHEEAIQKYVHYYDKQLDLMKHGHERQLSEIKNENKLEINGLKISHLEEIQGLRNKHDSQMEDLHQQHRNKLEDITHRFESIKLTLSDKVESLRGECEELRHRARNSEEALQRDADVKVQMALAPYMSLPKEIESLKTVLEMRNEEIQKLRNKNTDQEKQLEELPIAKEKIISLQQKVENLEAIINIKSDHEKQLHEHCQILMRKYDRATRANKRLSMDYEQVVWRMSQSSDFGSTESLTHRQLSKSPPPRSDHGSPESRHRNVSPNIAGEVVMRKKRNSHSVGDGDRKLRSRSATFVVEKNENGQSHSPSSSPQPKLKRWRKKFEVEDSKHLSVDGRSERMCRSAGPEILADIPHTDLDDTVVLPENTDSMILSTEMADSYSRSISGVSDSGVYDSMTRSDMLNSSVVSTDSEWATSGHNSFILDSSADEYGLQSGDYVLSRHNVGVRSFIKTSNTVVFCPSSKDTTGDDTLEPGTADNVFDDNLSMESSLCSLDNLDITDSDKQTS